MNPYDYHIEGTYGMRITEPDPVPLPSYASFYSYFMFAPDIASDERIIFGMITFDNDSVLSRFLDDWSRVEAFSLKPIDFLHEFAERVKLSPPTPEQIKEMAKNWHNSIQVTQPRAALLAKEVLMERLVGRALTNPRERGFQITTTPL